MSTMKRSIQKPENWQDFESLCKKLWGETWQCGSIKKNGRVGQNQHGIDIYGIPKGESNYFGIQCKGKDDHTKAKLTIKEINNEIKKASKFVPSLKCFIFATTANKDAKIEEYVREKNIESIKNGGFSIELYSWEDIADLIEENKNTYDWYINHVNHKVIQDIEILFENKLTTYEIAPIFNRSIVKIDSESIDFESVFLINQFYDKFSPLHSLYQKKKNLSFSSIWIYLYNSGNLALEEIKLKLEINGDYQEIKESNIENESILAINKITTIWLDENFITYRPLLANRMLVPKDKRAFEFYLKPHHKEYDIIIKWHFLSKNFDKEGQNTIHVKPVFKDRTIIRQPNDDEKDGETKILINDVEEIMK